MPDTASIHKALNRYDAPIDLLTQLDDDRSAYEFSTQIEVVGREFREEFEVEFDELSDREVGMYVVAWEACHLDPPGNPTHGVATH